MYQLKKTYRMSQNTGDFIWPIISFTVVVIISARVLDYLKQRNNNIVMQEQIDEEITIFNRDQNGLFTIFKHLQDKFDLLLRCRGPICSYEASLIVNPSDNSTHRLGGLVTSNTNRMWSVKKVLKIDLLK